MATDLFLVRKNQTFAKYTQVVDVSLTSSGAYSGTISSANTTTNTLTWALPAPAAGVSAYFSAVSIGGLTVNKTYYILNPSGNDFQLAEVNAPTTPIDITSFTSGTLVIIADDEMKVWSSEYRDQFASTISTVNSQPGQESGVVTFNSSMSAPGILLNGESRSGVAPPEYPILAIAPCDAIGCQFDSFQLTTPTIGEKSDELSHTALRQSLLKKTHWKFDRGASVAPRYLYAVWADGDIIADNPPDTK